MERVSKKCKRVVEWCKLSLWRLKKILPKGSQVYLKCHIMTRREEDVFLDAVVAYVTYII